MKTPEPAPRPGIRARRIDAVLDLLEHAAYEHRDHVDVERAAIGVTVDYERRPGQAVHPTRQSEGHGPADERPQRLV